MFSVLFSLAEKLRTYLSGARAPALPRAAGAAAVFLAAALVYLPVLDHDFVADDFTLIVGNDFVADRGSFSFLLNKDFLLQPYPVKLGARPLALLSLMTDHAVWGLDPFGYHLTNVLLHGLNSALLFLLVLSLGARLPSGPSPGALLRLALMSGLVFALHPLQAEAVSVASFRADLLSAFFCLSSLLAFTRPRYLLSLAFFALALFSKETAVVLPLAALLYAWVFRGAERAGPFPAAAEFRAPAGRARLFYAALAGAGALFFMVHFWAERFSYPLYTAIFPALGGASPLSSAAAYVNTAALSLLHYAGKLLLPLGLSLEYQLALPGALVNASSLAALAAGAGLLACLLPGRNPYLRFGAGFFLIAYLPVSNLVPLVNTVSDRYMYLPLAGFSLLVSAVLAGDWGARLAGLRPVLERLKLPGLPRYAGRALQAGLCLALVACYASRTSSESARFSGMYVLYSAAAAASPQNPNARYHLALAHMENGDYGSAALEFEALMAASPLYKRTDVWHLLGVCCERLGDTAGAKNYYSKVLLVRPGKETLNNLAGLMRREGRADSSAWLLKLSLEIEPDPATSNNLGAYYAGKKEFGTAMTYFRQAVNLRPDYTDAWFNLLNACEAAGDKAGLRDETRRMAGIFAANGWEVGAYAR
jgi:Flp pilus assembly protein TadD